MTDIYHSGIKGQKKGVRRYQYLNGTYTREGNLRYRPPSERTKTEKAARNIIKGAVLGEIALVYADHVRSQAAAAATPSIMEAAKTAITTLNANRVAAGKAVVETVLKIPTPVRAMALPILGIGAGVAIGTMVMNGEEVVQKIKDLPWNKIASNTISLGASSVGIALSTVSGNPLPAVAGMTISTLATMLEKEY